jgi:hypothetical protein
MAGSDARDGRVGRECFDSFDSYGVAPAAFMQRGPAFGDQATATIRE